MLELLFTNGLHIVLAGTLLGAVLGFYTANKLRLEKPQSTWLAIGTTAVAFANADVFVYAVMHASLFCTAIGFVWLFIRYRFGDGQLIAPPESKGRKE